MSEQDRYGLDAHTPGAKLDCGKNRLDLVLGEFTRALWEVGLVGTFGADKYTDRGWLDVPNAQERYLDALLRHYCKHKQGELRDEQSNLLHVSHLAWNALAVLELLCRQLQSTPKQQEPISVTEQDPLSSHTVTTEETQDSSVLEWMKELEKYSFPVETWKDLVKNL